MVIEDSRSGKPDPVVAQRGHDQAKHVHVIAGRPGAAHDHAGQATGSTRAARSSALDAKQRFWKRPKPVEDYALTGSKTGVTGEGPSMTGDQFENPALDPTRPWEDSPEVELELTHLVSGIRKRVHERWGADLMRFLAALLESGTALVSVEAEPVINFVNANATALGFVTLIEHHHETCWVTPAAQQPLRRALDRISRSKG